ncbi:MAG: DNA polymerase III subunit delta [Erysipelotrichaceae bacterium]|nr:DNA polymerase III subunit delta [Erysipelotrichaceae bacterium]
MAYNYIIVSDDKEAAQNKIEEIKSSVSLDFDFSNYDLNDDSIYSIIDEITTVSLFDSPKFVVISGAAKLSDASDKSLNELVKAMNDRDSENVIIFLFSDDFNHNNENLQRIKKYSSMISIMLKDIPIDEYIKKNLSEDSFTIDNQALALLVSYQEDLSSLKQILSQLKCYKNEDKNITEADIKLLIAPPLDDNVYELIEAVLDNDKKRIFNCFKDLKLQSIQASYLVSMLINKFQELYNVTVLLNSKVSSNDIAAIFGISSGRAYYLVKNAKSTNLDSIKKNLSSLNELEYKIKSGKIDQSLGLELYFLN